MDNADNLITISCFLPKQEISSMANLLIQLLYQEVYSLRSPISGPDVLFSFCRGKPQSSIQFLWKRKRTLPAVGDTSDATGNTQGLILCEKSDVNFSLLINDWSFGKECGSNVSSRLLGRSVTWRDKNGWSSWKLMINKEKGSTCFTIKLKELDN